LTAAVKEIGWGKWAAMKRKHGTSFEHLSIQNLSSRAKKLKLQLVVPSVLQQEKS
jgi:hypothetical protein